MNQVPLFQLIKRLITEGLTLHGVTGVEVRRSYQEIKTGTPSGPAVFFHPISDHRHGSAKQKSSWLDGVGKFDTVQRTIIESTYQVNARVTLSVGDLTGLSAADLLQLVADILQSDIVIASLAAQNVGVLRITDVSTPYVVNDRDRNDLAPSFSVTLNHVTTRTTATPPIDSFELGIHRV